MFKKSTNLRGRQAALAVLSSGIFLLVACGDRDASDTKRVEDGGVTDSATGGAPSLLADDLSVPLAPDADAVSASQSGPLKTVLYNVPLDQQAATIAFYDQWTEAEPDTYLRTESVNGGVSWQTDSSAMKDKVIISVLSPLAGDNFVSVSIAVGSVE